jgi:hypothetical protein
MSNVIRLMGGIGNQMYQYAFGKVFQSKGIQVKFETDWFKTNHDHPRPYMLDKFCTKVEFGDFLDAPKIEDGGESFDMDGFNFCGYWQKPEYYLDVLDDLKFDFLVQEKLHTEQYFDLLEYIMECDSVAVQVRRTDYGPKLPARFYLEALERTKGEVFIFSDDLPWCRGVFKGTFIGLETLPDYLCFELLRFCETKIIDNSTFGFWAAFLGDGTVYCPDRWYGNGSITPPKQWIQLKDYR